MTPKIFRLLATAGLMTLAVPAAHAQQTCTNFGFDVVSVPGFSCQIGDKTYSDFSFTGPWLTTGSFAFTNQTLPGEERHTINGNGLFTAGNQYGYTYKMTITSPPGPTQYEFDAFRTGLTSSSLTGTNIGTNTLTAKGLSGPYGPSVSPAVNLGGGGNIVDITTGPGYLGNDRGPMVFTGNINVTQGAMDVFTDSVSQLQAKEPIPNGVPGPLPILGAAAAFGSVRKLRRFSSALKQG